MAPTWPSGPASTAVITPTRSIAPKAPPSGGRTLHRRCYNPLCCPQPGAAQRTLAPAARRPPPRPARRLSLADPRPSVGAVFSKRSRQNKKLAPKNFNCGANTRVRRRAGAQPRWARARCADGVADRGTGLAEQQHVHWGKPAATWDGRSERADGHDGWALTRRPAAAGWSLAARWRRSRDRQPWLASTGRRCRTAAAASTACRTGCTPLAGVRGVSSLYGPLT